MISVGGTLPSLPLFVCVCVGGGKLQVFISLFVFAWHWSLLNRLEGQLPRRESRRKGGTGKVLERRWFVSLSVLCKVDLHFQNGESKFIFSLSHSEHVQGISTGGEIYLWGSRSSREIFQFWQKSQRSNRGELESKMFPSLATLLDT